MGKETRKTIYKTLRGVGNLGYVEVRNVPMSVDAELGNLIDSRVIERVERLVASTLLQKNLPIRGQEVAFFRTIFALSQRDFAEKLGLSHVAIFKWEKAKNRRLDLVNEIAVKVFVSGQLNLGILASLETLACHVDAPKRLVLNYSEAIARNTRTAA